MEDSATVFAKKSAGVAPSRMGGDKAGMGGVVYLYLCPFSLVLVCIVVFVL